MSEVLTAIREKYPAYADVPDDKLAAAIGDKYPAYLSSDSEFNSEYKTAKTKTATTPPPAATPDSGKIISPGKAATPASQPLKPYQSPGFVSIQTGHNAPMGFDDVSDQFKPKPLTEKEELIKKLAPLANTPETQERLGRLVAQKATPKLPTQGIIGQLWSSLTRGALKTFGEDIDQPMGEEGLRKILKQTPEQYDKWKNDLGIENDSKTLQLAKGGGEAVGDLADFFSSPFGAATLGSGALPKVVQRGIALAFAAQMASQLPDVAKGLIAEISKPDSERDYKKIGKLVVSGIANTTFAGLGVKHGLMSGKELAMEVQGPPARGDILKMPEGAKPLAPLTAQALEAQAKMPLNESKRVVQKENVAGRETPATAAGEVETPGSRPATPPAENAQTDTPAFKAWFGDSKVVDKDGNVNWDSISNEELAQADLRDKWQLWKKHEAAPGKYTVWLFADQGEAGNTGKFATFKSKEDYQKWQDEYPIPASGRAAPERVFYRSGDIPENYMSINQVKQSGEGGVSSYYTPKATSMAGGTGRKWFSGKGRQVGVGSDDEPIIIPTEKWKEFDPTPSSPAAAGGKGETPSTPKPGQEVGKSPLEILNTAGDIKITAPQGATMVRVTDAKGKVAVQSITSLKAGNVFQGADIKKIEAGIIGKDKKFVPMKGDVGVEPKQKMVGMGGAIPEEFEGTRKANAIESASEHERPMGIVAPASPVLSKLSSTLIKASKEFNLVLKELAGDSAPRTTAAHRQTGEQMVRYASSRIAARPISQAFTAHTLEGTGVDPAKFGAFLVEDNLRSIEDNFVRQANELREKGDLESADAADSAAKNVASIVGAKGSPFKTEDDFWNYLNDPNVQKALSQHIQQWQEVVEPQYKAAQGIDPDVEMPTRGLNTGARINLKVVTEGEEAVSPVKGVSSPSLTATFTKRSPFGIKAKGTGETYEINYHEIIANTFERQLEIANKNKLDNMLVENGLAEIHRPGWRGTIGGEPAVAFPLKRGTRAIKTKEGETIPISSAINLYIKGSLAREYRTASNVDARFNIPYVTPAMNLLNKVALSGLTDFTIHVSNQMTSLFNRPTSGKLWQDTFLSSLGRADVPVSIVRSILKATKNNQAQIAELAEIGALRESGKHKGILGWSGDTLRKTDQTTRLMLDDTFKNLVEDGLVDNTETGRREYANQIGQYNRRLQGPLTRFLRDTGFGPFVTAGKTFNALGVKVATLSPGVKAANNYAALQLRANALSKWIGASVLVGTINYLLTKDKGGGVSGRPGTPLGRIDTGLNDKNNKPLTFPMFDVLGLSRGERVLGVRGFIESKRMGLTTGDAMDSAARDIINAAVSPAAGPPVRFSMVAGTGYPPAVNVGRVAPVAVPGQSQSRVNVQEALLQANPPIASLVDLARGKSAMEALSRQLPRFTLTPGKPPEMVERYPKIVNLAQTYAYADDIVGRARKLEPAARRKFIADSLAPLNPEQKQIVENQLKRRKVSQ